MLHIRCGRDIVSKLRASGLPGEILVWEDPVSHGPTPDTWTAEEWYAGRAAFLARAYGCDAETTARELRAADAALDDMGGHDEVVLWFEHDLFDQSILIRLLSLIRARARGDTPLSLVSIASHREVPRFIGLGNLDPAQLAALFPARTPVTSGMLATADRVWRMYASRDPGALAVAAGGLIDGFPWLPAALTRHLEELPWVSDGLSRTERHVLTALAAGARTPSECFLASQDMEQAPWMGDSMFYRVMADLASRSSPLLTVRARWLDEASNYADSPAAITSRGRAALRGESDSPDEVRVRWVGGVRLGGNGDDWRWNPLSRRPVRV